MNFNVPINVNKPAACNPVPITPPPPQRQPEQLLDKEDVAKMLKQTSRSVDNHMKNGMPYFKVGRSVRFRESLILKWLDETGRVR